MKLSVCMIVKNEEAMLEGALESVLDADEIIVCDTGSTDSTVEIARKYTDHVYTDFVWCDDFAAARNHANSKATGDWILVIDADEKLAPGGMQIIRQEIESAELAVNCLVEAVNGTQSFYNTRVYRNSPEVKWLQPIHNYLNVTGDRQCDAKVIFGYSPAHRLDPDRALRILSRVVAENPNCGRERYYLAREYYYRKDWERTVAELNEYFPRSKYPAERADGYLMQARALWNLRRGDEARNACMNAITINANFKEAILFMAELSWERNARTWRAFAAHCTNEGVLFVRTK